MSASFAKGTQNESPGTSAFPTLQKSATKNQRKSCATTKSKQLASNPSAWSISGRFPGERMSYDPVVREHQEWLGFLQPVGLVVSPTALKNAQARIARNVTREQEILIRHTHEAADPQRGAENRNVRRRLSRFTEFAKEFWGWEDADLATPPDNLSTALQEYGEILRPDLAVPGVKGESEWQILIQELAPLYTMDQGGQAADERSWQASPQARFERL